VYRFISTEKARTRVSSACAWLGVSRSGYYEWTVRAPSQRVLPGLALLDQLRLKAALRNEVSRRAGSTTPPAPFAALERERDRHRPGRVPGFGFASSLTSCSLARGREDE
jgi:putative transposase